MSLQMEQNISKSLSSNIPFYKFNPKELVFEISQILSQDIELVEDILPYFNIRISDIFIVSLVFGIDQQISFIAVHGTSERNKTIFEQSEYRVFRILTIYFSRVLPHFLRKYHEIGIYEFSKWLKSYETVFITSCSKCGKCIEKDHGNEVLPPIIKSVNTDKFFHIKCSPQEIDIPDFISDENETEPFM